MIEIFISLFYGLLFVVLLSFIEGCYYDYVYRYKLNHPNLHPILFCLRLLFLLDMVWRMYYILPMENLIPFIAVCVFSFSFFHEGVFYTTRNYFAPEKYKKRWFADKEFDTTEHEKQSKINIPSWLRTSFFVFSLITLFYLIKQL